MKCQATRAHAHPSRVNKYSETSESKFNERNTRTNQNGGDGGDPEFLRMAVENKRLWPNGKNICVEFLGDAYELHEVVKETAREWEKYANITFDFDSSGASDIRISFCVGEGNYSVVGTAATEVSPDVPTMNLDIAVWTQPAVVRRHILHEFGHALGCIHEHCSPSANISWNASAVYSHYNSAFRWDQETVDKNILRKYSPETTQYSPVDAKSIMMYPIKGDLTNGSFSTEDNLELSTIDIEFIAKVYPKLEAAGHPPEVHSDQPGEGVGQDSSSGDMKDHAKVLGRWAWNYGKGGCVGFVVGWFVSRFI